MSKLTTVCTEFRALQPRRNTLIGYARITMHEMRLEIRDVAIHEKGNSRWAQLPARPAIRDGAVMLNPDNKPVYQTILAFSDRKTADASSVATIKAVLELFPEAFEREGA